MTSLCRIFLSVLGVSAVNDLTLSFQIDNVRVGTGDLFLIAGPCVIESEEHALRMAEIIKGVVRSLNVPFIFKASYDKANRTSIRSYRGPGMKEGLRILKKVKEEVHVPVLTDVHRSPTSPQWPKSWTCCRFRHFFAVRPI